jgi:hypothetical protein
MGFKKIIRENILIYLISCGSVGVAMDYGLDGRGSIPGRGFIADLAPTQPSIQYIERIVSPGVNRPGSEAECKEWWSYTWTSPFIFMAWCLID